MRKAAAISIILIRKYACYHEQHDSHWTDFREIFYSRVLQNILNAVYFLLLKNKTNILYEELHISL